MTTYKRVLLSGVQNGNGVASGAVLHTVPAASTVSYTDSMKVFIINNDNVSGSCTIIQNLLEFNPNANSTVYSVVQQSDGKILLAGQFTSVGGVTRSRIARVHDNGAVDTTFDPNASSTVYSVVQQSDGKILLAGQFTSVGGVTRNRIARVFDNGAVDTTFNPNAGSTVYSVFQQSDGKILLGGGFLTVGGVTRNRIARVGEDGTITAGGSVAPSVTVSTTGQVTVSGYINRIQ